MSDTFPTADMALTHILVVADVRRAARWYSDVLGAEPFREYGTSAVFSFNEHRISEVWVLGDIYGLLQQLH